MVEAVALAAIELLVVLISLMDCKPSTDPGVGVVPWTLVRYPAPPPPPPPYDLTDRTPLPTLLFDAEGNGVSLPTPLLLATDTFLTRRFGLASTDRVVVAVVVFVRTTTSTNTILDGRVVVVAVVVCCYQ